MDFELWKITSATMRLSRELQSSKVKQPILFSVSTYNRNLVSY